MLKKLKITNGYKYKRKKINKKGIVCEGCNFNDPEIPWCSCGWCRRDYLERYSNYVYQPYDT